MMGNGYFIVMVFLAHLSPVQGATVSKRRVTGCSTDPQYHFPNIKYLMKGYNVLFGYPLSKTGDPGFYRKIFETNYEGDVSDDCAYQIPFGVEIERAVSCITSFDSTLMENSKDLRKSLSTHASGSGGAFGVEFSASAGYQRETQSFSRFRTKIVESSAECRYYTARLMEYQKPDFSDAFKSFLRYLNETYSSARVQITNEAIYSRIFDTFGTHYIDKVVLGARYVNLFTMSSSTYSNMVRQGVDVEFAASYTGPIASASASFDMSTENQKKIDTFKKSVHRESFSLGSVPPDNGDAEKWASTVKDHPRPVEFHLRPIWELFEPKIFPNIRNHLSDALIITFRYLIERVSLDYCVSKIRQNVPVFCSEAQTT